jgi:hypothetical protein
MVTPPGGSTGLIEMLVGGGEGFDTPEPETELPCDCDTFEPCDCVDDAC